MEGLTHCVNSIYGGVRSTSASYLTDKPNVTILSSAIGKKVNFDGVKATSVTVIGADRTELTFTAKYEIILACGVFETPKLLMLSGIGPKDELARHGIDSVVDSEHVGKNLHDHPILAHVFRLKDGTGLDSHLLRAGPAQSAALQKYRTSKKGPFSSGLLELVGLPRIDDRLERYKEYREAKAQNGGQDPFGPEGQPHFEIDFVVSHLSYPLISEKILMSCSRCSPTPSNGTSPFLPKATGSLSSSIFSVRCPETEK